MIPRPRPVRAAFVLLPPLAFGLLWLLDRHGAGGIGLMALLLGLRHAFDADHIAAIDNVTRRLRDKGRNATLVGLFFSLGHSSIVLAVTIAVVYASRSASDALLAPLTHWGALLGTLVSAAFLTLIGLINLRLFIRLLRGAAPVRAGIVRPGLQHLSLRVEQSWQAYPLGLLFGLSFDTASEIALLALAVGAAQHADFPMELTLVFPLLFAAGMGSVDLLEGLLMARLYDWAASDADRSLRLNTIVTGVSVGLALAVAGSQWWQLFAGGEDASEPRGLSSNEIGLLVTISLLLIWLCAWLWRRRAPNGGASTIA